MLSLPVPVIVSNFTLYYTHAQARLKLPKKSRKQVLLSAANALVDPAGLDTVDTISEESGTTNHTSGSRNSLRRTSSEDSAFGSCHGISSLLIKLPLSQTICHLTYFLLSPFLSHSMCWLGNRLAFVNRLSKSAS